ncbi:MAG TPA: sugar phosphate nucleotidyltransferase [Candidatus Dormibacteraeota bacterium]|nr:sugar phosphate nucleotidyltransferase [Candidatus Dormibacteraeota bacterium]
MHDVDAVVLAGGIGTRLRPYTFSIPKPLIRLGEQPIIEILLQQLHSAGVRRVHVALGHLGDLMQAYLDQTERRPGLEIRYSLENEPLGTIGPIKLIRELSETVLLINGDVLTTLSYPALVAHHRRRGCVATVAVTRRQLQMSYGVVDLSPDARIVGHREKPCVPLDVAMGIYVFQRSIVDRIPAGRRFDVPDLIQSLLAAGEPIAAYRSSDYWMDIGCAGDYEHAQRDFAADPDRFLRPCHRSDAATS